MVEDRILAKIAELYYMHDISQKEISKKLNYSTAKICRLLNEAKKRNIIEFKIINYNEKILQLERNLENKYNLREVIIYDNYFKDIVTENKIFEEIGLLASNYLERVLDDNMNIALSWGMTLYNFVNQVNFKRQNVKVFASLGGVDITYPEYQSNFIAQMLAHKIAGKVVPMYSPLIFNRPLSMQDKGFGKDIELPLGDTSKIDYFFTSVGNISEKSRIYLYHGFDLSFLKSLAEKGVVGEMSLSFYDIKGNFIESGLENKIIKLNIKDIKKIKNKVILVFGKDKLDAIKGILNTDIFNILIIDSITAELL